MFNRLSGHRGYFENILKISENWWLCIHLLVATCPQIPGKCLRTQSIHKDLDLSHSNRWKIANYSRNWTLYFICESNQQLSGVVQAHQISTNVRMMNAWDYLSDCLQRWKMKYKGGKKVMMERPKIGDFVPAADSDTFPTKTKFRPELIFFSFFFVESKTLILRDRYFLPGDRCAIVCFFPDFDKSTEKIQWPQSQQSTNFVSLPSGAVNGSIHCTWNLRNLSGMRVLEPT